MRPARAADRLRRLLVVVPYIVRHPGVELEEVARLFDVTEHDLASDLNLVFMSGLPPYGPGDLIDVQIEDGRVWITMADYFSRPLRLTRTEALSLYLRAKALAGTPGLDGPALASALGKLEDKLGPEALRGLAGRVEATPGDDPGTVLDTVRAAAAEHQGLEIEYYSASRDEVSERRIDPEAVFSAIGKWYVVAWDHRSGEERMFRVDRIREARGTGEGFEPRGLVGAGRPLYSRSPHDILVRLVLQPSARWVAEYYETESVTERRDGSLEVTLPTRQLAWVARLAVRLGGAARVVEPPELVQEVREVARRTLERYGRVG